MTQREYENLIGKTVTAEEFEAANALYMSAGDMDKETFCADWKEHCGSAILKELCNVVPQLEAANEKLQGQRAESHDTKETVGKFLARKAEEYQDREMERMAEELLGTKGLIEYKLKNGYKLYPRDINLILAKLSNITTTED